MDGSRAEYMRSYMRSYRHMAANVDAFVQQSSQSSTGTEDGNGIDRLPDSEAASSVQFESDSSENWPSTIEIELPDDYEAELSDSDDSFVDALEDDDFVNFYSDSDDSNSDYDSDYEEAASIKPDLHQELAAWATRHRMTRPALNDLLDILIRQGNRLPKDGRTLLKTPRSVQQEEKCGGAYSYFGLESGILKMLSANVLEDDKINLHINIDGVPLSKSGVKQLWPILCSFGGSEPFIVALFMGNKKPTDSEDYLSDFLTEYSHLKQNGVTYGGKVFQVYLQAVICDAPAREFVKGVVGHTGYFSCERCTVKGTWEGRVVFNESTQCPHRTEDGFNKMTYANHQKMKTPFIDADVPCISTFVLDYMHLVCLGVMRRILYYLIKGPRRCRLSASQIQQVSSRMTTFNGEMPSEFARQPRSLDQLDRWKATEFRQFLLYTGPVVLKGILNKHFYTHFLLFSTALSILLDECDRRRNSYLSYARQLLECFVNKARHLYGDTFVTYNVHSLKHLHEDVEHFHMSLNDISAFKYENYLQKLKRMVRGPGNAVSQISKRLQEFENSSGLDYLRRRSGKKHHFSAKKAKDATVLLKNESFAVIVDESNLGYICDVISQRQTSDFFKKPCQSSLINIVYASDIVFRNHSQRKTIPKEDCVRKVVRLRHEDGYVYFPLLHDSEK